MNTTPIKPNQPTVLVAPRTESRRWKSILDGLLPERPIAEMSLQDGNVLLSRSVEKDSSGKGWPIWTKKYGKTQPTERDKADLSIFNAWESALIEKATTDKVLRTYRLAELYRIGSPIHTGDTPLEQRTSSSVTIKTYHAGADLNRWREMQPWVNSEKIKHPFVQQANFLKLVKGILQAASEFHIGGFVHCDFHPGNIVLPAQVTVLAEGASTGERYQIAPEWDKVTFIDLGYSLHQGIEPHAMLPLSLWQLTVVKNKDGKEETVHKLDVDGHKIPSDRMSTHLRSRLLKLEKIASEWPSNEIYKRENWKKVQTQLNTLNEVDWREDLYQLGYWLAKIRDGHAGQWGHVHHTGQYRDVNHFICSFPEELMQWGVADKPGENPHADYVKRIDALLATLPKPTDTFILHRCDHDTAYADYMQQQEVVRRMDAAAWDSAYRAHNAPAYSHYIQLYPQGEHVAKARALYAQCLQEERLLKRQQRYARWRVYARKTAHGAGIVAGLAGLVGAGQYGLQAWQSREPAKEVAGPLPPPPPPPAPAPAPAPAPPSPPPPIDPAVVTKAALQSAENAISQAKLGSLPWRTKVDELATLCNVGDAPPGECTRAFTAVHTSYLAASQQAQKTDWWTKGQFTNPPSADLRNWLFATRSLAQHGLWTAQVNQAMADTVDASRTITELAPGLPARIVAAKKLAALVTPAQQPSAFGTLASSANVQALRTDAADLLWELAREGEGEGEKGHSISRQLAPTAMVLPVVQAVADMPAQAIQVMLGYSLVCWARPAAIPQAIAYWDKAATAHDASPRAQAIAAQAKAMRQAQQNGAQLCKK